MQSPYLTSIRGRTAAVAPPKEDVDMPPKPSEQKLFHDYTVKTGVGAIEHLTLVSTFDRPLAGPPAAEFYVTGVRHKGEALPGSADRMLDPAELAAAPTVRVSAKDAEDPVVIGTLRESRASQLEMVFHRFDYNSDGFLDVSDMRVFGWAMSAQQRVPTPEEAALQISKADLNKDGVLDYDEWMRYAANLGRMPDHQFNALIVLLCAGHDAALSSGLSAQIHAGEL